MKYLVENKGPADYSGRATVVYSVRRVGQPEYMAVEVLLVKKFVDGQEWQPFCYSCPTLMSATSSSCVHARAVKRLAAKEKCQ